MSLVVFTLTKRGEVLAVPRTSPAQAKWNAIDDLTSHGDSLATQLIRLRMENYRSGKEFFGPWADFEESVEAMIQMERGLGKIVTEIG